MSTSLPPSWRRIFPTNQPTPLGRNSLGCIFWSGVNIHKRNRKWDWILSGKKRRKRRRKISRVVVAVVRIYDLRAAGTRDTQGRPLDSRPAAPLVV
jgi:hypothetical protein